MMVQSFDPIHTYTLRESSILSERMRARKRKRKGIRKKKRAKKNLRLSRIKMKKNVLRIVCSSRRDGNKYENRYENVICVAVAYVILCYTMCKHFFFRFSFRIVLFSQLLSFPFYYFSLYV